MKQILSYLVMPLACIFTAFALNAADVQNIRDIRDLDTNHNGMYDPCEVDPNACYQAGPCVCYCPVTRFCKKDYCETKCVQEPVQVQKKCCRYVDKCYTKKCCRMVPQPYTKTCCRQKCVPEYYEVQCTKMVPQQYTKTCCRNKMVPEYYEVQCTRMVPQPYTKTCCRQKCVPEYYEVPCCKMVPQPYTKTCCRNKMVPEYYQVECCRQVPEYYDQTYTCKEPEYYTVCETKYCNKYVKEPKCCYVPYTCMEKRCINAPLESVCNAGGQQGCAANQNWNAQQGQNWSAQGNAPRNANYNYSAAKPSQGRGNNNVAMTAPAISGNSSDLAQTIKGKIESQHLLSQQEYVDITFDNGTATLSGIVLTPSKRSQIEAVVTGVNGVQQVNNQITVGNGASR